MKKTILDHLPDKVICQFTSDLIKIIAVRTQRFLVVNPNAVNIFHNKHMRRRIFLIQFRDANEYNFFILFSEFFHIGSFRQEIHLFPRDTP